MSELNDLQGKFAALSMHAEKPHVVKAHMLAATVYAQLSHAKKRKVGAIVVQNDTIIGIGYNGTPAGWDNSCEDEHGLTKPEVIHAEQNALDKVTRGTISSVNAVMYCTTAPCLECAKRIYGARIAAVFYHEVGRNSMAGLEFLAKANVIARQV